MTPSPAQVIWRNDTPVGTTAELTAAFAAFNDASRQLEASYRALEQQATAQRVEQLLARHRRLSTLGEMAATLAHQVRTPLAAALLYASNARRNDLPAAQRDAQLDKAMACMQDLERLIADMLQFARGARPTESRFTLTELLEGAQNALTPILEAGQALTVETVPTACMIDGNRESLAGALVNLVNNALQAAGPTARVRITAEVQTGALLIHVQDNGPGVDKALRERIFEPFFTSRTDGTGLGLAVARSVARAHGGELILSDSRPGHTTFTLRLTPAAAGTGNNPRQQHDDRNAAA